MHVCIYLRKDRCGCAAGGRAACNIDAILVLLRRRCHFFFSSDITQINKPRAMQAVMLEKQCRLAPQTLRLPSASVSSR